MANNQEKSDTDQPTVTDPLDAVESTNSGTQNELAAYEAERAALLAADYEPEAPQGDEPAAEVIEPAEEEAADEATTEEDEDAPEPKDSMRPRLKDPMDIAVATLAKAKGISLIEASRIIGGFPSPTERSDDATGETTPSETVASVTTEIKDLQTQKREALAALEFETAATLDEQIDTLRDKRDELRVSEVQEKSKAEKAAEQKFYSEYEDSQTQATQFYPDAEGAFNAKSDKAKTPLAQKMVELDAQMKELGDPLYHSQMKPLVLAKEAARLLGIPMTKPGTAPAKKSVQTRPMQPAGGNARTTAASPASSLEDAIANARTLEEYEKLVGRG